MAQTKARGRGAAQGADERLLELHVRVGVDLEPGVGLECHHLQLQRPPVGEARVQASSSSTTPCASKRSRSAARHRALYSAADPMAKRVSCATELMSAAGSSIDRSTAPPPGTGTGLLTKVLVLDSSALFAASGEQSVLPLIFSLMHLLLADPSKVVTVVRIR